MASTVIACDAPSQRTVLYYGQGCLAEKVSLLEGVTTVLVAVLTIKDQYPGLEISTSDSN